MLAKLQIDYYCDPLNFDDFEGSLKMEMKVPNDFYQATTDRIDKQGDTSRDFARRALAWVTQARRPLDVEELCHAVYFMPRNGGYTGNPRETAKGLVRVCAGLIVLDTKSLVRVFHHTVKEYLESPNGQKWLKISDSDIGSTCIEYLSNFGESCAFNTEEDALGQLQQSPLLRYAAQHWGDHIRADSETRNDLRAKCLSFLRDSKALDLVHQIKHFDGKDTLQHTRNVLPIHMAASFDLISLLRDILDNGGDIEATDSRGQTALHIAIGNGHVASAKLLLGEGANYNSKDFTNGWTPLHLAAWKSHQSAVDLLLKSMSTPYVKIDRHGQTALHLAALNGDASTLKQLLSNGFDAKIRDGNLWNVLHIVAWFGNTDLMESLLNERKFDIGINSQGKKGLTPLHCAAGQGHRQLTSLLLRERADKNAVTSDGWTPLHWASVKRHDLVVPRRLKIRVKLSDVRRKVAELRKELTDHYKSIDWIFQRAHPDILPRTYADYYEILSGSSKPWLMVKNLLTRWSSTIKECFNKLEESPPSHVSTILEIQDELSSMRCGMACAHEDVVRCLLEENADFNLKCRIDVQIESRNFSGYDFTSLHIAVLSGHEGVVRALLDTSIDPNQPCTLHIDEDTEAECTTLHLAVICGHVAIIDLLLRNKVNVGLKCCVHHRKEKDFEISSLILAVFFRNQEVIPHLLERGVDVDELYIFKFHDMDVQLSALHLSILMGDTKLVLFLVQCGATIDKICQFKYGDEFNMTFSVACMAALFQNEALLLHLARHHMKFDMVCTIQAQAIQLELPLLYLTALTMSDTVVRHVLEISPNLTKLCSFRFDDYVHIDLPILPFLDPSVIPQSMIAGQIKISANSRLRIHIGDIDLQFSTFLMSALCQNRPMMLFLLKEIDVDTNEICAIEISQKLSFQASVLHLVVWSGHADVVAQVLEKKADVNAELKIRTKDRFEFKLKALHLATLKSDEAMVLLLLKYMLHAQPKCVVSFYKENDISRTRIQAWLTPLHLTILQGNIPFIRLFLLHGSKNNTRFEMKFTSKTGRTETKIDAKPTAVYLAALTENSDAVTLLLDYKFHTTRDSRMTLIKGSTNEDTILPYFTAALGVLNPSNTQERRRLDFEASLSGLSLGILLENTLQTVQLLAQAGEDSEHVSQLEILSHESEAKNPVCNLAPWHFAALTGLTTSIDCLLDTKMELDIRVHFPRSSAQLGPTALQLAARFGNEAIVRCLIDRGAILQGVFIHGENPLELAKKYGHESIINLFIKTPLAIDKEWAQRTSAQMRLSGTTYSRRIEETSPKIYARPAKSHDSQEQEDWPSKGLFTALSYINQIPTTWNSFVFRSNSPVSPPNQAYNQDGDSADHAIEELSDSYTPKPDTSHAHDENRSHSRSRDNRSHGPRHRSRSHDSKRSHRSRQSTDFKEKRRHRSRSNDSRRSRHHSRGGHHLHPTSRDTHRSQGTRRRSRSHDSQHSHRSRQSIDSNGKRRHRSRSIESRHSRRRVQDTKTASSRGIWHQIKNTDLFSQVQNLVRSSGPTHASRDSMQNQKREYESLFLNLRNVTDSSL